jgi:outer membrane protein with beta-barrel domain
MFHRRAFWGAPVLATFLAFGATASAQEEVSIPKYEIGLTYSGLHVNAASGDNQRNGNGGSGSFEYNLNKTIGLVADFGGYANTGHDNRLLTYMFGPRFNWRHSRLNPYVQFLFGGAYLWNNPQYSTTQNAFATAAGGGLDYRLTDHIAIKPIQVEYVMTQINSANGFGSHQNDVRYSAGVVLRLGAK